jgi:hypothetical protein
VKRKMIALFGIFIAHIMKFDLFGLGQAEVPE